jgi:tRNA G18 (ribose-2'-O)-methylase SpoU
MSGACAPLNSVVASHSAGAIDALNVFQANRKSLIDLKRQLSNKLGVYVSVCPDDNDNNDDNATPPSSSTTTTNNNNNNSDVQTLQQVTQHAQFALEPLQLLVFGSEGSGVSSALRTWHEAHRYTIVGGDVAALDSLNVGVAAAVTLERFVNR